MLFYCSVQITEPQRTQKNIYVLNKTFRLLNWLLMSGIAFLMTVTAVSQRNTAFARGDVALFLSILHTLYQNLA